MGYYEEGFIAIKDGIIYDISYPVKEQTDGADGLNVYKVINTFKIINNGVSDWQTYRNEEDGFEFEYPAELVTVFEKNRSVLITRFIDYKHSNPCDFEGDGSGLDKIVDFNVSIEIIDKNLQEAIKEKADDYSLDNYVANGKFQVSPGYIDEVKIGSFS